LDIGFYEQGYKYLKKSLAEIPNLTLRTLIEIVLEKFIKI